MNLHNRIFLASLAVLLVFGGLAGCSSGPDEPTPPAPPTDLTATPGDTVVDLSWTASDGATDYAIYKSTTSGIGYGYVGISGGATSYQVTGLENGTTYYFVVTAYKGSWSGFSNEASAMPNP